MANSIKCLFSSKVILLFALMLPAVNSISQWLPDVRLTNNPAPSYTPINTRCISVSGSFVHVVWSDFRDGNYEIYYKRSTDGGSSWGTDIRQTNNSAGSGQPLVSATGPVILIVWSDQRDGNAEIYCKRSVDTGATWGVDLRLTNSALNSFSPSVAISGSIVHLVWTDYRHVFSEIYYKRSNDTGATWGSDTRLTFDSTTHSEYPSVSASGQNAHIVWSDERNGINGEIYYKRSTDSGINWDIDARLTNNPANSDYLSCSVSGVLVHAVWQDERDGNKEIYYKRSTDAGITWGTDTRLTNNTSVSEYQSSACSGQVIHIVWEDERDLNKEIYYKRSNDGGMTWETDMRLTSNSSISSFSSVAVLGTDVHVAWYDQRDGNPEIYYKGYKSGNTSVINVNRNNLNKLILDNQSTYDTIQVSNMFSSGFIADVNVKIDTILHPNDGDLEISLIHAGITDTIIYQAGSSGDNFITTILNDSAATGISNGIAPFNGSFRPSKPLTQFINFDPAGSWILRIYDRATGNTGSLKAWGLTITVLNTPIGIQQISTEIPSNFSLSQNYPNPFNPATNIKFAVPSAGFVKILIFDMLGREVETLVNEKLNAGIYNADWDASKYSSGIYFYKLETGNFTEAKKMILVK
jgi:subtilisin-like proprotein convertase family protein